MSKSANPYEIGLDKNAANYVPLSPIGFLLRSASVYPNRVAVAYAERRYTWREALGRCRRLASALAARGIGRGDTVALMAPKSAAAISLRVTAWRGANSTSRTDPISTTRPSCRTATRLQ